MLITAHISEIDPFSNISFEEVFVGDLPVLLTINASATTNIVANVIKSVIPASLDASASTNIVSNRVVNVEELEIDASDSTDIIGSTKAFAVVDIDASSSTDIIGSLNAGVSASIDATSSLDIVGNRIRTVGEFTLNAESTTDFVGSIMKNVDISMDASAVVDMVSNRIINTGNMIIGTNILIDMDGLVRFDMSGNPRESIGTNFYASVIKETVFEENVEASISITSNIQKNLELMSIDASTNVSIDANVI